jgi:hypothetical protein
MWVSPAEVMYQHQFAPLPLGLLEDVPQPVVVLLEVLLEKDPSRRFQNRAGAEIDFDGDTGRNNLCGIPSPKSELVRRT